MLYILTGEQKYADLARQGLEMMFDDGKYSITADVIKQERGKLFNPRADHMKADDLSKVVVKYGQPDRDERYT